MAKVGNRQFKTFTCTECKGYSYRMDKNVKNTPERMEISKYCPTNDINSIINVNTK